MNKIILTLIAATLLLSVTPSFSQITLLSNNTNLSLGVNLNGRGILLQDNGNIADSLWVTDGTPTGTIKFTNTVAYVDTGGAALYNNKLFFSGVSAATGTELWATDGTAAGTSLIKDINVGGNSLPTNLFVYNNTLFFTADDGTHGFELWKTDGTSAGTVLVKDIYAGAGSGFSYADAPYFTINNGVLYFTATTAAEGLELWRTDGSTAGTTLVKDITPGSAGTTFNSSFSGNAFNQFAMVGTNLVFGVKTGTYPLTSFQLWKSDGTAAGTTLLKDFGALSGLGFSTFYTFNNKVYFNAGDLTTGSELWVTDATVPGTTLVKDIEPGATGSYPLLFFAITLNNKFYFEATTTAAGSELWVSDGTTAGTQLLKDINPGGNSSSPTIFKGIDINGFNNLLYNNKIFFSADDGTHGTELWITDGTSAGTTLVKDINPGTASGFGSSSFGYFYTTSGLFFGANDGSGNEPWVSDGTTGGTNRIADVNPGSGSADPSYLFVLNNQLYFNATNGDDPNATDLFKINASGSVLPVTLMSLSATVDALQTVKLNWITTNEINSDHFEIERSADGNKFSKIGEVNAAGKSTTNISYTFADREAATINSAALYYRVVMVDKDGKFTPSPTLLVHLKEQPLQITFYPNPAIEELNVLVSPAGAKNAAIRIIDGSGRTVYMQKLPDGVNILQQKVNISGLQKGAYFIQLISDDTTTSKPFLKQ